MHLRSKEIMPTITTPISSTFATDIPLSEQEAMQICDWKTESDDGRVAFGHTPKEAEANHRKLNTPKQAHKKEMTKD